MTMKPLVGPAPIDSGSLAGVKPPVPSGAIDPAAFADAHRQLLGDSSIQFDLPAYEPPQPPQFSGASLPFIQVIFWIVVAAIVLFVVYLLIKALAGRSWARRPKAAAEIDAAPDWRPEASAARALLGDADALAAQGRYSEAARLLLHRSIGDIDDKRPELVRPALTSRDIAALGAIPDRPRSAFARIAMMVERSLFAGRALVSEDWAACRAAYEDFAFAEGWRG